MVIVNTVIQPMGVNDDFKVFINSTALLFAIDKKKE